MSDDKRIKVGDRVELIDNSGLNSILVGDKGTVWKRYDGHQPFLYVDWDNGHAGPYNRNAGFYAYRLKVIETDAIKAGDTVELIDISDMTYPYPVATMGKRAAISSVKDKYLWGAWLDGSGPITGLLASRFRKVQNMKIEIGKVYITANGNKFKVTAQSHGPTHFMIEGINNGVVALVNGSGRSDTGLELIRQVPETKTGWVNILKGDPNVYVGNTIFSSREAAEVSSLGIIVDTIEITYNVR